MIARNGSKSFARQLSINDRKADSRLPLFDVQTYHHAIRESLDQAIAQVISSGHFIGGPEVTRFEERFAEYCGTSEAVGVANGTDALILALRALDIGPGDEVITTSYSFVATAQAIVHVGAIPRFVDIEDNGFNLDPAQLEEKYSDRTRAILVVHLFGRPAPMNQIKSFADKHGLAIVEDAAQAHGARMGNTPVGSLGDIGCFSFYPTKNLGALGDGGAIVTNDSSMAKRIRSLANHDQRPMGNYGSQGTNSRLDALQAAVLSVKLPELDERNSRRRQLAKFYDSSLSGLPVTKVHDFAPEIESAPNIYPIRVADDARDSLMHFLDMAAIESRIYYQLPLPRMVGFQDFVSREELFPHADRASRQLLALPFHPDLEFSNVERIVDRIRMFFEERQS